MPTAVRAIMAKQNEWKTKIREENKEEMWWRVKLFVSIPAQNAEEIFFNTKLTQTLQKNIFLNKQNISIHKIHV